MGTTVRWLLALTLAAIISTGCASGNKANAEKEQSGEGPQEAVFSLPAEIPATLLPTLVVGVDSCYVFLLPDENSRFFGPLTQGEIIKRLDAYKYWINVWIPRLRISGWVRKHKVYASAEKISGQATVPTEILATVSIAKKRVNVRKGATLQAPVICVAEQSQRFLLLDEKSGWYQVWVPHLKEEGWVSSKVVVKQDSR